jgi:hypothetical protein
MAVLTSGDDWAGIHRFPGALAVLAAQSHALPQPDQLCGPFSAHAALQAVLGDEPDPSIVDLARAAGTAIWPHDVAGWRPAGAPLDRSGWDRLPVTDDLDRSGTDAAGLARGVETVTSGRIVAVPATGPPWTADGVRRLLAGVREAPYRVGVVANVRTGPMVTGADDQVIWDVGHFVVLWGLDEAGDRVAVADTYRELGAPGGPPGCRVVPTAALVRGLAAPPGRGLLLLVREVDRAAATELVLDAGLTSTLWIT